MIEASSLRRALACIALLAVGCSSPSGPSDPPASDAPGAAPDQAEIQAAPSAPPSQVPDASPAEPPAGTVTAVEQVPAQAAAAPSATGAATSPPPPVAAARPAPAASAPAPAPTAAPAPTPSAAPVSAPAAAPAPAAAVVDRGGPVAVVATKPGLSRVGSDACEMCHEEQFASWAGTAHASRKPPLDCESCHGPGSAYKTMAIMKDPAKARAAGLVIPERSFCSQCHVQGLTDELMKRSHAADGKAG